MNRRLALAAVLVAALSLSTSAAEKRAASIADLYRVQGVAEPAIAPDSRTVATRSPRPTFPRSGGRPACGAWTKTAATPAP